MFNDEACAYSYVQESCCYKR